LLLRAVDRERGLWIQSPYAQCAVRRARIETKAALLAALAAELHFPDYFGMNWDALDECLSEVTEPTAIVWTESARYAAADPTGFSIVQNCFAETSAPVTLLLA
jgi:RNAse (barnase) inhibitor barstar